MKNTNKRTDKTRLTITIKNGQCNLNTSSVIWSPKTTAQNVTIIDGDDMTDTAYNSDIERLTRKEKPIASTPYRLNISDKPFISDTFGAMAIPIASIMTITAIKTVLDAHWTPYIQGLYTCSWALWKDDIKRNEQFMFDVSNDIDKYITDSERNNLKQYDLERLDAKRLHTTRLKEYRYKMERIPLSCDEKKHLENTKKLLFSWKKKEQNYYNYMIIIDNELNEVSKDILETRKNIIDEKNRFFSSDIKINALEKHLLHLRKYRRSAKKHFNCIKEKFENAQDMVFFYVHMIDDLPLYHMHKIEIIPYTEQVKTRFGKSVESAHIESDMQVVVNPSDCENLRSEALLAMCELVNLGLINKQSDIYDYRSYIYQRINTVITSEKRLSVKNGSLLIVDNDGVEHVKPIKAIDKIGIVEKSDIFQTFKDALPKVLDKRCNIGKITEYFTKRYELQKDIETISKEMRCSKGTLSNYEKYIKKAFNNPIIKALMTDYLTD